jgi:hypothetical protein
VIAVVVVLVTTTFIHAEIRFRRTTTSERLVDPTRIQPHYGLASAIWDSSSSDSSASDSLQLSPEHVDSLKSAQIILPEEISATDTLSQLEIAKGEITTLPSPDGTATGTITPDVSGSAGKMPDIPDKEVKAEEKAVYHPTLIYKPGLQIDYSAELDTATDYVVFDQSLAGGRLSSNGAMTRDVFLERSLQNSDQESWRQAVIGKMPTKTEEAGTGIKIDIPLIKNKRAQRLFGGSNVGLTVSGNINVSGNMTVSKTENVEDTDPNPTDYSFKIDQKQSFIIKGKVGEKVAVDINQDSERLFDFENNLSVRYTGYEDEIIQSIEAGNVSLSLGGASLISGSASHQGLFGLKTVSQFGALKLTTVASLEKGEKQQISIEGGAQSSGKKIIYPSEYIQYIYFFLDDYYRELYRQRSSDLLPLAAPTERQIADIEVYKSISGSINRTEGSDYTGWALFDPDEPGFDPENTTGYDAQHQLANFEQLREGSDYYVDMTRGYLRMNNLSSTDILAVAYSTGIRGVTDVDTVGDLAPSNQKKNIFKLIKTKNPQPSDSTWNLMWRNVYSLKGTNIDPKDFDLKITYDDSLEAKNQESGEGSDGQIYTYLEMFGLDYYTEVGNGSDGRVDDIFISFERGELIFPDLTPFSPQGWYRNGEEIKAPLLLNQITDTLYKSTEKDLGKGISSFDIEVEYKSVSSSYQLSFNVLKGSVEVYLNGQKLTEGTDYTVDYISGELTILRSQALSTDSDISITYENAALFQLDTKTLLGIRAEYELWENSRIGATAMHLNESTMDRRIRIGGEPKQNTIWDVDMNLNFKPMFLTSAADWLPLIETDEVSTFTISGEFAQVFPNPNSLNSSSTGDYNGVAYVDDFESITRITPLGINRSQWTAASIPEKDLHLQLWNPSRGRMIWFNPFEQINITDIWPDKEVQAQSSKIPTLKIQYKPWWNDWSLDARDAVAVADTAGAPLRREYWGGIMRYLGSGYADQTDSKYLEIWLNRGDAYGGTMYIDLGTISEDVIPDGKLNTEDRPSPGKLLGNGVLTPDEDTGIDTVRANDPIDLIDVNGDGRMLPAYDDWEYNYDDKNNYSHINGTEGNKTDEGGRYPDSEDLNNNTNVDRANDFFRYTIDFSEGDASRYIVGGKDNTKGWRLYRIPLKDTLKVGKPQMSNLEFARIWYTGFNQPFTVMIAQMDIVGNEWQETEVDDGRGGKIEPVSVSVINSDDNDDYNPPPGVTGERDPVTGFIEREQSLVLDINRLRSGESGYVIKELSQRQSINLIEYRQLKMFVNLVDKYNRDRDLELFFRFGDTYSSKYYEYSRRLKPGWEDNEVIIDLDRLTSLNSLRQEDSLRTYDILPDGSVIRVVGTPSIRDIAFFSLGLKNHGKDIYEQDGVEVWFDEMRVSDVHRDPGWAATGALDLKIAKDLLTLNTNVKQSQATFHDINKRVGSDNDLLTGRFNLGFRFDALFNPQWYLSMPFAYSFKQDITVPRYQPGGDLLLSTMTGEQVDIWSIFLENLKNNDRYRDDPEYQGLLDQQIKTAKSYSYSFRASKTKPSDNIFTKYTIEKVRLQELSYSKGYATSSANMYDNDRRTNGTLNYDLNFEKPLELNWLQWSENVPLLGRASESKLRPLPSKFGTGVSATEAEDERRAWTSDLVNKTYSLTTSRNFSIGFRPITPLSIDFSQSVDANRIREDSSRYSIALNLSELDSLDSQFWIDDTSGMMWFDSTKWQDELDKDIKRIQDKIFWEAFGANFVDHRFTQSFSMNFAPQFVRWLGTSANYSPRYTWVWGQNNYSPTDRQISCDNRLSTDITFRLPTVLQNWQTSAKGGQDSPVSGGPGDELMPEPYTEPGFNPDSPGGSKDPFSPGSSFTRPEDLNSFKDQPSNGNELFKYDLLEEDAGSEQKPDSLTALADSLLQKKEKEIASKDPLLLVRSFLGRMGDISWTYNQTNNIRNSGVGFGQAGWKYRLGLSRDPELEKVNSTSGYSDTRSRSDQHSLGSSFNITRNLVISRISYDYSWSHTIGQSFTGNQVSGPPSETGSYSWTVWQSFDPDKVTIKSFPILNWTIRWGGWEQLPFMENLASSITLNNSFRGSKRDSWEQSINDTARVTTRIEYEKNFSPLAGITFNWKKGISTDASYNLTQRVSDEIRGDRKTKDLTQQLRLRAGYTSQKGFRIPIPVWPFKNKRFQNSTTFSLAYENSINKSHSSASGEAFTLDREEKSWSIRPSVDYRFSSTVTGGFHYEYAVTESINTGKNTSQDFGFSINISIRG